MRNVLLLVVALAAVPLAAAATIKPAESKALLRIASRLSALPIRRQVPVVTESPARFAQRRIRLHDQVLPPARQRYDESLYAGLGLAGGPGSLRKAELAGLTRPALYDPRSRTLYATSAAPSRTAMIRELVVALQDQAFDLKRVQAISDSRDASFAAEAAVDGHAALVASRLGSRSVASHGGPALSRFLQLETGFAATVGERFAVTLRNLGGNQAVFGALRRFPETTEQIFHLDKFLEREQAAPIVLPLLAGGLPLVGDDTFGELDVRALLATFGVPRLDHVGEGWGGGRSAIYQDGDRRAVVLALDWDEELDAVEWAEAVRSYVNEAFDPDEPGPPATTACAAAACWDVGGHPVAFERSGVRTVLVLGPDVAAAATIAQTILGLR